MPDPLSKMGVVRKPMFEMFPPARNASRDPTFSNQFREDLAQDEGLRREQRITDLEDRQIRQQERAQRAVNQFTRQPASTREQFLEDRPEIALSPQFGDIQRYQAMSPVAARTLAPSMAAKLPPAAASRFNENINTGMDIHEAFNEARDFDEQEGFRTRLAPLASDEEIKARFPEGRFSAPEVARFEYEQKKKFGTDPGLELLQDFYSMLSRQDKANAAIGKVDPEVQDKMVKTMAQIEDRMKSRLAPAATPPAPAGTAPGPTPTGAAAPAPATVGAPRTAPASAPKKPMKYGELLKTKEQPHVPAQKDIKIDREWTEAKQGIEGRMGIVVPDIEVPGTGLNQREEFARAVLAEEDMEFGGASDEFGSNKRPVADVVLQQMQIDPYGREFVGPNPGGVTNRELLKAWAESYLQDRGKLLPTKESASGSIPSEEEKAAFDRLQKIIRGEK